MQGFRRNFEGVADLTAVINTGNTENSFFKGRKQQLY